MKRVIYGIVMLLVLSCTITMLSACGAATEGTGDVSLASTDGSEEEDTADTGTEMEASDTATEEESKDIIPESYACTLRVTINPQVLLYLDQDYKIIGICYENEDALDAYAEADLFGKSLEDAVDLMIEEAYDKDYLKTDGTVSIELAEIADDKAITDDTVLTVAKTSAKAALEEKECDCKVDLEIAAEVQSSYSIEITKVPCTNCYGTGILCPGDHETSGIDYEGCHGTGITVCLNPICNGGACTQCSGSGRFTCFGCHGTGVNDVDGMTCNHCNGSGTEACQYCHGTGNCERCNGTGQVTCYVIDQHTTCPVCDGTGFE